MLWLGSVFVFSASVFLYMTVNSEFGGKLTNELKDRYSKSPNWENGKFENLIHTAMNITPRNIPSILKKQITEKKMRMPVHWKGFDLSLHSWTEPIERVTAASNELKLNMLEVELGEICYI